MDDTIFQSKRSSIHLESCNSPSNSSPKVGESKAVSSWRAILLESKSRLKVVQNKTMITISLFNIVSLFLIIQAFFDVEWLIINETPNYYYWVNLVSIGKYCKSNASGDSLCQESEQEVYETDMLSFYSSNCQMEDNASLSQDDPANLCTFVQTLRIAGALATFGVWLGMLFHLYCITKFLRLTSKKLKNLVDMPSAKRWTYVTLLLYFLTWLAWLLYSVLALPNDTQSSFFGRLGLSLYLFLGGVAVFAVLAFWYDFRLASSAKMNLVSALLDAETKYSRQVSVKVEL